MNDKYLLRAIRLEREAILFNINAFKTGRIYTIPIYYRIGIFQSSTMKPFDNRQKASSPSLKCFVFGTNAYQGMPEKKVIKAFEGIMDPESDKKMLST